MIRRFLLITGSAIAVAVASAGPAAADPASALITYLAINTATVSGALAAAAIRLGVGLALSYVSQALLGQRTTATPGIRTESRTEGGALPQTRILGTYATAGNVVAPFYADGVAKGVENGYRWSVYDLADRPVTALSRFWVDGKLFEPGVNLNGGSLTNRVVGAYPLEADEDEYVTVRDGVELPAVRCLFSDGTQTTVSPVLNPRFASHPERPWTADMVGRGIAYAIMHFRFRPDLFRGEPQMLFEVQGERLYDRRADTTDGGLGAQRAASPSTWAWSDNPVVMVENILRGLPLDEGGAWGLGVAGADLPRGAWTDAANACDATMPYGKRFRAGFEVRMGGSDAGGDMPLDVVDELLKACTGQVADCGGEWLVRVGPPGASVAAITDEDIIVDEPQEASLHEGVTSVFNAARATHPHRDRMWQPSESPIFIDTAALAQDGGQLLVAELQLPAVPYRPQVKALQRAYVRDSRRFRRHTLTLPPAFSNLQPLDAITWTSARNGYVGKRFEIAEVAHDPVTLCVTLAVRERDPSDYDWSADDLGDDPGPSAGITRPQYLPLPEFDAQAASLDDLEGPGRDPAIRLVWSKAVECRRIQWEGRRVGSAELRWQGQTDDVESGRLLVASRIQEGVDYQFRARGLSPRTGWSAWDTVTWAAIRAELAVRGRPDVCDETAALFRQGPTAQNLQTAGWRSASTTAWTRVGGFRLRKTTGAVSRFHLTFRVAAWGDDAVAELRLLRRREDGTFIQVGSCLGRAGPRGGWVDVSRWLLDPNKAGAPVSARQGTPTLFVIELRRSPIGGSPAAVRVNNVRIEATNIRLGT